MSKRITFRAISDAEFIESAEWYEEQRDGLGAEFIEEVEKVLEKISENPELYPVVLRDIREAIVSRFPFAIYYRVKEDRVVVLSVFHTSRNPAIWQARN